MLDVKHRNKDRLTMPQRQNQHARYIPVSDKRSNGCIKCKIHDIAYQNSFKPRPVYKTESGPLFEHQGFLMQGLHMMYLFAV